MYQNGAGRQEGVYVDNAGNAPSERRKDQKNEWFSREPTTDLQRLAQSATGEKLSIFGQSLFDTSPSTFAPTDQIPLMPDYTVGPGDQILLRIWGHDALNGQLTVDSTGSIYVPNVGPIHVAGLRVDQLEGQIRAALSHTLRNFDISASLGHLRSIQIYLVGEVRRPGLYTVSSLSTVLDALFVSGGPNSNGSMRQIQVKRAGKTTGTVDLYELALRGDKSKDIRLESGDVVFVPKVGPQAVLAGSVAHPAIYELLGETTVHSLLEFGGGLLPTASPDALELQRIGPSGIRMTQHIEQAQAMLQLPVLTGDVIIAKHISLGFEKTVTLRGNLANPGQFSWQPGMKLSDILPDQTSLLTPGYWEARNRLGLPTQLFEPKDRMAIPDARSQELNSGRTTANGSSTSSRDFNSGTAISNSSPAGTRESKPESTISNQSLAELQQETVSQNVASRAEAVDIQMAAPEIDWSYAVIERLDARTLRNSLIPFNLGKIVLDHDKSQDVELKAGDIVTILSQTDAHVGQDERTKYIRLEGEFASSGTYSVKANETLAEVVARAGGLTGKAYLYGASFTRETARVQQQQRLDEYVNSVAVNLERASAVREISTTALNSSPNVSEKSLVAQLRQLKATGRIVLEFKPTASMNTPLPSLVLEDGDVLRVPSRPLTVSVIGAVYGPSVFLFDPNRRVRDYLLLAGSPTRIADRDRAFIIRADGSIFSHERAQGFWSNTFNFQPLNPGDTIVIPEKQIKPSSLRQIVDYSSIFSSVALGAASLQVIK